MYNTDHVMTGHEPFLTHYKTKNRRIGLDAFCTLGRHVLETVNHNTLRIRTQNLQLYVNVPRKSQ